MRLQPAHGAAPEVKGHSLGGPQPAWSTKTSLLPPQVRISVQSSPSHADCLKLEVINNQKHLSSEPQQNPPQSRSRLVQEVVRLAEEAQERASQQPRLSREEREFSQSRSPNLYSLLEEVRELALMDLETSTTTA